MKQKTVFICQNCGFETPKWLGKCPSCGSWESFVEETRVKKSPVRERLSGGKAVRLTELVASADDRKKTGIGELDRVLGGGVVRGSLILIGGEPGIGKSTLTLQVSAELSKTNKVLYASGEESTAQTKLRAERLGIARDGIFVLAETELENILEQVDEINPGYLIIDSIQTMYKSNLTGAPGSVGQVRECTADLLRASKERGISTFIIGHVTKFGAIAGPKTLEHMVDTVLYFEGDRFQEYRILRAVKNRFGSTNEIGVFQMTEQGLLEVSNPSLFFLAGRTINYSGSVVVATIEGSRPLLVELQALATPTVYSLPQRLATGFDFRRLSMLLCVLERRGDIPVSHHDVFCNIVGGLRIEEPAVDLGILVAVASSVKNKPLPLDTAVVGEVGLGGEIRSVSQISHRIKEAERLGFKRLVLPKRNLDKASYGIELSGVTSVKEAIEILLTGG
jgi:DNA repair protein RadA/Sms